MVFMVILFAELYIAGVPGRLLTLLFVVCGLLCTFLVMISSNRRERILSNYTNCNGDTQGMCYQSIHGIYALATGGITGVGPGASREKWSYLPEAHNDFILSIIGEEIGIFGTLGVIICYIVIIYAMFQIIIHNNDARCRIITGGVVAWIGGQAILNIGAVLRILPVIGVPLPLISYGGTSLISLLWAIGVVMSFTKDKQRFFQMKNSNKNKARGVITLIDDRRSYASS
jgi:cell division protein FtsW